MHDVALLVVCSSISRSTTLVIRSKVQVFIVCYTARLLTHCIGYLLASVLCVPLSQQLQTMYIDIRSIYEICLIRTHLWLVFGRFCLHTSSLTLISSLAIATIDSDVRTITTNGPQTTRCPIERELDEAIVISISLSLLYL
jgi:hypothetical protein